MFAIYPYAKPHDSCVFLKARKEYIIIIIFFIIIYLNIFAKLFLNAVGLFLFLFLYLFCIIVQVLLLI